MSPAQEAAAPEKIHCPFKLASCSPKCRANNNGKCSILEYLEGVYFKVILG